LSRERLPARAGSAESQASGIRAGGFFLVRLLCLAPLLLATACAPARRTGTEAPNVVLISVDTLRADHLGCYGAPAVETPAIDRLAAEGVRFQHAYSPAPLTLPAHWTIHTGIEPWRHGVLDNGMVLRERPATTLAERFSEAGYDTAAFVAAFVLNRAFGLDRGFRHYDDGPGSDAELDQLFHSTAPADERVSRAHHWLRRPRSQPFFLWLHLYDPHSPYEPPSAFRKLYADRPYDGEIAFVDMQLARLLTAIESSPEGVRTLIVLLSDHGESLGEHGELTHGMLLYDATLQVPLIFRLPSRLPAGAARPDAVTLADVAPTVLALAGLPPGEPVDGVDLFGPTAVPARKLGAVSEMPRRRLGWAALAAVREGAWKFILAPRAELFRIADDPRETLDRLERDRAGAAPLEREARRIAALTRKQSETLAATEAGAEDQARIAALGYISGPVSAETRGANPRDAIGFLWARPRQSTSRRAPTRRGERRLPGLHDRRQATGRCVRGLGAYRPSAGSERRCRAVLCPPPRARPELVDGSRPTRRPRARARRSRISARSLAETRPNGTALGQREPPVRRSPGSKWQEGGGGGRVATRPRSVSQRRLAATLPGALPCR
jgi:arylsulfatase A-like enzyme